jgi:transcriptional regulator with XRE-family HTH domain
VNAQLEAKLLRRLRHELGLTRRQLARSAGVDVVMIEEAESHGLPIFERAAIALSSRLGIDLTSRHAGDTASAEVELLGAVLAELRQPVPAQAIGDALGWTAARVHDTAAQLRIQLQRYGQTVTHGADDRLALAVYGTAMTDEQREVIHARTLRIDAAEAKVIFTAIAGRRRDRSRDGLTSQEHAIANQLIAAGGIGEHRDVLELTDKLAFAIGDRILADLHW